MGRTQISGEQILDQSIKRADLDTTTPGNAIVTKLVAGTGISLNSTGVDAGTGDVTINASVALNVSYDIQRLEVMTWLGW